jgi:hypothetical protein
MTTEGFVKLTLQAPDNTYLCGNSLPGQTITIETSHIDLNIDQYFKLFKDFLSAVGFNSISIMKGATELAFSEGNDEEDMKVVAEEYGLLMEEQLYDKIAPVEAEALEYKLKYEEAQKEIHKLQVEIIDLSAHLSRARNPDNPNYTDKEMEALTYWAQSKQSNETPKNDY